MVKPKTYKCGKCDTNITKTKASAQCEKCKKWMHANCAGLSDVDLEVLRDLNNKFYCEECKSLVTNRVRRSMILSDNAVSKSTNSNEDIMESIKGLREEIRDLRYDLKFYAEQYEVQKEKNTMFGNEIRLLKRENEEIKTELRKLKGQYLTKENENRITNVIVMGIKSTAEEVGFSPDNVIHKTEKVLKYIDSEMNLNNVQIKLLSPLKANTPVLVTFKSVEDKHKLLKKRKSKGKIVGDRCGLTETNPIFINEDMSKETRELYASARTLRNKGYKYIWAKDGRIFARQDDNAKLIRINSLDDIEGIIKDNPNN